LTHTLTLSFTLSVTLKGTDAPGLLSFLGPEWCVFQSHTHTPTSLTHLHPSHTYIPHTHTHLHPSHTYTPLTHTHNYIPHTHTHTHTHTYIPHTPTLEHSVCVSL